MGAAVDHCVALPGSSVGRSQATGKGLPMAALRYYAGCRIHGQSPFQSCTVSHMQAGHSIAKLKQTMSI